MIWQEMAANLGITLVWGSGLLGALLMLLLYFAYRPRYAGDTTYIRVMEWQPIVLFLSLTLFCSGLALHAMMATQSFALWIGGVWASLALLFLVQTVQCATVLLQENDNAIEQPNDAGSGNYVWSGLGLLLVIVNFGLLVSSATPTASHEITKWARTILHLPVAETNAVTQPISSAANLILGPEQANALPMPTLAPLIPVVVSPSATNPKPTATQSPTAFIEQLTPLAVMTTITSTEETPIVMAPITNSISTTSLVTSTTILVPTATPSTATQPPQSIGAIPDKAYLTISSQYGANVRTTPNLDAPVLTVLPFDTKAIILGQTHDSGWFMIEWEGNRTGWVAAEVVASQTTLQASPIISAKSPTE